MTTFALVGADFFTVTGSGRTYPAWVALFNGPKPAFWVDEGGGLWRSIDRMKCTSRDTSFRWGWETFGEYVVPHLLAGDVMLFTGTTQYASC